MNVGEKIKKFRELKNYTQNYMAEKLDLSLSGYGKIERNETDISISRLESIAEVLGTDIASILSFDEKNVFNFNNNDHANGIVQYHYAAQDELIERIIQQYKDENKYLKALIEKMIEKQQK
jgi:transcriptional regulator with XRE-family HTH domain